MNTLLIFLILLVGHTESVEPDTTFFDQNFQHPLDSRKDSVSNVDLESTKYKHRNIISGTGIPMEAGQFEWKNIYLLFNQFGLGITDKLSTSASFLIIPDLGIVSDFEIAYLISTSYAIWQKENIYYLKVSGFVGKGPLPQFRQPVFFGFYASNTIGNPRNNFSFGIGYGKSFISKEYSYDNGGYLITSLGGNIEISKNFSLVSDLLINTQWRVVEAGLLAARGRFNNFYFEVGSTLSRRPFPYLGFGSNILRK